MTAFNEENFEWDGMYLMYNGEHENAKFMEQVNPDCHPSWVGKIRPEFIARFKYGKKPWRKYVKELVQNFEVEEYLALAEETSPRQAINSKGACIQ